MISFVGTATGIFVAVVFEDSTSAAIVMNAFIMLNALGVGNIVNPA